MGFIGKASETIKSKSKTRRGRGKGSIKPSFFSILGNNINGISGKSDSLLAVVKELEYPTVLTIQESKISSHNYKIPGYQPFFKNRVNQGGGGLITAVAESLHAVQVSDVKEDILVVEIVVSDEKIRVINAYGPQEPQTSFDKEISKLFWLEVEKQVVDAKNENCKVVIQCDANTKLGKEVFPKDIHDQTVNGSFLAQLIQRNDLYVLNSRNICSGVITRSRNTTLGLERSILDYVITCEGMNNHCMNMLIDESRKYVRVNIILEITFHL